MYVLFCQISQRAQHFCGTEHGRSGGKTFFKFAKKTEKLLKSTKRKVLQKKAGIKILKSFTDGKMRIMDEVYFFIYRVTRK